MLPADKLHCFNFITISFKREYLKLNIEVVPAYSNVTKPIFLTSGCPKNPFPKILDYLYLSLRSLYPLIINIPYIGQYNFVKDS